MPRLDLPPDEPWLAALVMPTDTSVDDVRERARRVTRGEVSRRRRPDDPLRIRSRSGSIRRTEFEPLRVAVDHDGDLIVRDIGGDQ
jgi:hypothetical protein